MSGNTLTPETIADRIQQRLDALGMTERAASLAATGSDGTIRNIRLGKSVSPKWETIVKLAEVLQCSPQWLMTGEDAPPPPVPLTNRAARRSEVRRSDVLPPRLYDLPVDLPVYGTVGAAAIGNGAFQITSDVVDYVRRPFGLLGAKDAYALFVEGDSMWPRFEPGDPVFVHPHRKPLSGDDIVIQEPDSDNGEPQFFIKRLLRVTPTLLKTKQFNPPLNLDFVIRPGLTWHKVMSSKDLYGM